MTDYGQDLLFGTFITPLVQPATHAVELAMVSERAGLDLVTFQDHPYQPRFHDTWTLLCGGRLELGIGAGGFWDAIEAMGGRRLTPGQSVEALEEAIQIIREIWATDKPGGVQAGGTYYQVKGAKRGPRPAHNIGIWVGAYKPRILNMTGRVADGWLPTLAYLQGGVADLEEMNTYIDEGAAFTGRDPSSIRRLLNISGQFAQSGRSLLNGPPRQWAEDLAEITLTYGITGFLLAADDASSIELFAAEVAPATRELVAAQRARR
jgi:alkanesulfonate monooxygenase SsuD/methylene tetrahydromethanopterin reductase-like flavin-dependent oxidoreductase (luciferase family)